MANMAVPAARSALRSLRSLDLARDSHCHDSDRSGLAERSNGFATHLGKDVVILCLCLELIDSFFRGHFAYGAYLEQTY